jgi:hypothetical protein
MKHLNVLVAMMAVMVLVSAPALAAVSDVQEISGEIKLINVKLGTLHLARDAYPSNDMKEYRISSNDTRVADPSDQKFVTIDDLQAGQHVMVHIIKGQEDKIVQKIVAEPYLGTTQEVTKTTVTTTTTTTTQ